MTIGTECCLCIMELNVIGIIGIGVELPSPEFELNCLRDFVPDSELNLNCFYRNLNCKYGIDPGSASKAVSFEVSIVRTSNVDI